MALPSVRDSGLSADPAPAAGNGLNGLRAARGGSGSGLDHERRETTRKARKERRAPGRSGRGTFAVKDGTGHMGDAGEPRFCAAAVTPYPHL